jgi:adenosine deaminase
MSVKSFIEALPKVELHIHLEGGFDISRLLLIADQYDVPETMKHYADWVKLLNKPDYHRLYDLIRTVAGWVRDADDLSRLVYDLGTHLHKQNVRYAEVGICPALYPNVPLDFEAFFAALNDGRDRAERAWGIRMAWVFNLLREDAGKIEGAVRWTGSIHAQRSGVIGIALVGRDDANIPAAQYERFFRPNEHQQRVRAVRVGEMGGVAGVRTALEALQPNRVLDARGLADDPSVMEMVAARNIPVLISPTRYLRQHWAGANTLPLRALLDAGVPLIIGSDMPSLYQTTLNAEYLIAVESGGLTLDDVKACGLRAIAFSLLSEADKEEMTAQYEEAFEGLRVEHQV